MNVFTFGQIFPSATSKSPTYLQKNKENRIPPIPRGRILERLMDFTSPYLISEGHAKATIDMNQETSSC